MTINSRSQHFFYATNAINAKFKINFTTKNVEKHYKTLKKRYAKIRKARELSGARWNDAEKMITLPPEVYKAYIEVS